MFKMVASLREKDTAKAEEGDGMANGIWISHVSHLSSRNLVLGRPSPRSLQSSVAPLSAMPPKRKKDEAGLAKMLVPSLSMR